MNVTNPSVAPKGHRYTPDEVPEVGTWVKVITHHDTYWGRITHHGETDGGYCVNIQWGAGWWIVTLDDIEGLSITTKEIACKAMTPRRVGPKPRTSRREYRPRLAFGA